MFVYPDVRNVISSFLRVLQHYRNGNTTPTIDMMRTLQRISLRESLIVIDKLLRRRLSSEKKSQLEVDKEHDSIVEHFFRRDDEGDQDLDTLRNQVESLSNEIRSPNASLRPHDGKNHDDGI